MDKKRYSEQELEEFKDIIEKKLTRYQEQFDQMQNQIREISEAGDDDYASDWLDNSSVNSELDMLTTMAERQVKYIHALEDALMRIRQKTYGVCVVTGELIDEKRLRAVPTTTKSMEGKRLESIGIKVRPSQEEEEDKPRSRKKSSARKVTTRVIRRKSSSSASSDEDSDDDRWLDKITGADEDFRSDDDELELDDIADEQADEPMENEGDED